MKARRAAIAAMVAAAATVVASEARADWRIGGVVVIRSGGDRGERGGYDRYREGPAHRYGFDRGWREGSDEGYKDGRRGRDPRYWRESEFRDADRGYKRWMGPRWDYQNGFREGYRAGYRRAFAAARPSWRGRWERFGWGDDGGPGRYPYGRPDERRDDGRYRREDDRDWNR
jgi:hypothetical protein